MCHRHDDTVTLIIKGHTFFVLFVNNVYSIWNAHSFTIIIVFKKKKKKALIKNAGYLFKCKGKK